MLQDIEAVREPELEALVGSVMELGRLTGVATPHIDAVYSLDPLLAQTLAAQRQKRARARCRLARHPVGSAGAGSCMDGANSPRARHEACALQRSSDPQERSA
jgi:hypothetical protein